MRELTCHEHFSTLIVPGHQFKNVYANEGMKPPFPLHIPSLWCSVCKQHQERSWLDRFGDWTQGKGQYCYLTHTSPHFRTQHTDIHTYTHHTHTHLHNTHTHTYQAHITHLYHPHIIHVHTCKQRYQTQITNLNLTPITHT